jgi:Sulfatase
MRSSPTSGGGSSASRSMITRWVVERFIWFGFGVFVTISVFHGHRVHTTDQFEASTLASFLSFEPPPPPPNNNNNAAATSTPKAHLFLQKPNNNNDNKKNHPLSSPRQKKARLGITEKPGRQQPTPTSRRQQQQLPEKERRNPLEKGEKAAFNMTQVGENVRHEQGQPNLKPRVVEPKQGSATRSNSQQSHSLRIETKTAVELQANASQHTETKKEEDDRLNILLLYADDWTMKVLGKFDPNIKTPNIDKMADNGLLFTNNCVTTSVCWISRTTLVTGVYYSRHLQFAPHSSNMFTTNPWNETLFPKLKSAGYYTGLMGKWHMPQPEPEMTIAFDKRNFYYGQHWSEDFSPHGSNEKHQITDKNLVDALDFLQTRPKDKPFFLKVSYFATHAWDGHKPPYMPKNETRRRHYPPSMFVQPPKTATEWHWENLPRFFNRQNEGRSRWRHRFDEPNFQESIKDLYAMATEVDTTVGVILEELKKQNVMDKTVIIFTTDNGNLHGEHGLAEKW